jgi:hypothetical protein
VVYNDDAGMTYQTLDSGVGNNYQFPSTGLPGIKVNSPAEGVDKTTGNVCNHFLFFLNNLGRNWSKAVQKKIYEGSCRDQRLTDQGCVDLRPFQARRFLQD